MRAMPPAPREVTRILDAARLGDVRAAEQLLPLVYDELRRLADAMVHGPQTLQATALVHEAYLRLADADTPWESRAHFLGVAARAMRSILVDHARARAAAKRGGALKRVPLDAALAWFDGQQLDLLALDEALTKLASL